MANILYIYDHGYEYERITPDNFKLTRSKEYAYFNRKQLELLGATIDIPQERLNIDAHIMNGSRHIVGEKYHSFEILVSTEGANDADLLGKVLGAQKGNLEVHLKFDNGTKRVPFIGSGYEH